MTQEFKEKLLERYLIDAVSLYIQEIKGIERLERKMADRQEELVLELKCAQNAKKRKES